MDTTPTTETTSPARCECGIWPRVYDADIAGQPIVPADLAHLAAEHPEAYDRHIRIIDRDRTHEEPASAVAAREARRADYEARGLDVCGVPIDQTGCTYERDVIVDGQTITAGRGWLRDGRPV